VSLTDSVSALFTDEWERFLKGLRQLDPDTYNREITNRRRAARVAGEAATVNIPGWDDVIKIGPRYPTTKAERDEYYKARREKRAPTISPEARLSIESGRGVRERMRTSAQPEWAEGWGSILTALDNVQDFLSTVATLGRLTLWTAPTVAGLLGLERGISGRAALYLAGRVGARFVPVLGWVILASDLMNLISLAGMLATPAYGVLCTGSLLALTAGAPTMLFKRALKTKVWNAARRNPFGRTARLNARARAIGKLPSIGNLAEVAQTTAQLWGYGLSFGAIVGFLGEAAATPEILARGGQVEVGVGSAAILRDYFTRRLPAQLHTGELMVVNQASRVLASAPLVAQHQDLFTTEEHLEVYTAILCAVPIVKAFAELLGWEPAVERMLEVALPPPLKRRGARRVSSSPPP